MFFESNQVNDLLKCNKCEGRLDEPRILECGSSICSYCFTSIQINNKRKFQCLICDELHEMPEAGLPINKLAKHMLAVKVVQVSRGQEFVLLQESLTEIQKKNVILKYNLSNPGDYLREHFIELRNDVQLSCEQQCAMLNDKCQEIINEIDEYASELSVINLDSFKSSHELTQELDAFNSRTYEFLKQHNLNESALEDFNKEACLLKRKAEKEIGYLKDLVLNERFLSFFKKNPTTINKSNLGEMNSSKFFSRICILFDQKLLLNLCGINLEKEDWRKIYVASQDGFLAKDFHSKCDNKPNTFIIISTIAGSIFGGYTEKSWSSDDSTVIKSDPTAYIYNFKNQYRYLPSANSGIVCSKNYGPNFGDDLVIGEDARIKINNSSKLGHSYTIPDKCHYHISGQYLNFQVEEMEVFTRFN